MNHTLKSVSFPKLEGNIEDYAFMYQRGLSNIDFPLMKGNIGSDAFILTGLSSVNFPSMTGIIKDSAFRLVSSLINASFPLATGVGSQAFPNPSNVERLCLRSVTDANVDNNAIPGVITSVWMPKLSDSKFQAVVSNSDSPDHTELAACGEILPTTPTTTVTTSATTTVTTSATTTVTTSATTTITTTETTSETTTVTTSDTTSTRFKASDINFVSSGDYCDGNDCDYRMVDVSELPGVYNLFWNSVKNIDISGWVLNGPNEYFFMFESASGLITIDGTFIDSNLKFMFSDFKGSISGIPEFGENAMIEYMFYSCYNPINVSGWDLRLVSTLDSMFNDANNTVTIEETRIKHAFKMFSYFSGEIIGTPIFDAGANCESMFDHSSEMVNMDGWDLSPATNTKNMFAHATGSVSIEGTQLKNASNMFRWFDGQVSGKPVIEADADLSRMFDSIQSADINVDFSGMNLGSANLEHMFFGGNYLPSSSVNIDNTIIGNSDYMFEDFDGTLSGTPRFAEQKSHEYMFMGYTVNFDFRDRVLTSAMNFKNMFREAKGDVTLYEDQYALIVEDEGWISDDLNNMNINIIAINSDFIGSEVYCNGNDCDYSMLNISYLTDFTRMFMDSVTDIDISGWVLRNDIINIEMFKGASGTVTIDGTFINSIYPGLFREFTGSITGTPVFGENVSTEYMFQLCHEPIDLSGWDLSLLSSFNGMFEHASSMVTVGGTRFKNAYYMFRYFQGEVSGTPVFDEGANCRYMFIDSNSSVNMDGWDLSPAINTRFMFASATGSVSIEGTRLKNASSMFRSFNGQVSGKPIIEADADLSLMFRDYDYVNLDLSDMDLSSANAREMFEHSSGSVNVDNTIIGTSNNMFQAFEGTLSGTPRFAEQKSHEYMFDRCTVNFDFRDRVLTSAMNFKNMFEGAKGDVTLYEDQYALIDEDEGWLSHNLDNINQEQRSTAISTTASTTSILPSGTTTAAATTITAGSSSTTASQATSTEEDDDDTGLIVGLAVGGAAILVVVGIIVKHSMKGGSGTSGYILL